MNAVALDTIKKDASISKLISAANHALEVIGYTEHGVRHVGYVSHTASEILRQLEYPHRLVELSAIAGWVHDVGNCVNRHNHGISGATLLYPLLSAMDMPLDEVLIIVGAVGNHEEQTGSVVSAVSAALIIADKSDAHRTRVRRGHYDPKDIHDRVNYAIQKNTLTVSKEERIITFALEMERTSSVMDFLEIYLSRMVMCEKAANFLGCRFNMVINGLSINNNGNGKSE